MSARTRGSRAEPGNLGLPPQDCTVCTAFCEYATNEVDRDASMLMQQKCTDTYMHRRTHTYRSTHAQTNMHRHTHAQAHTRTHMHTHTHTHAHTYTHTLAIAPKQHAKLAHACSSSSSSSSSSSDSNNNQSGSGSGFHFLLEFVGDEGGHTQTPRATPGEEVVAECYCRIDNFKGGGCCFFSVNTNFRGGGTYMYGYVRTSCIPQALKFELNG